MRGKLKNLVFVCASAIFSAVGLVAFTVLGIAFVLNIALASLFELFAQVKVKVSSFI